MCQKAYIIRITLLSFLRHMKDLSLIIVFYPKRMPTGG